MNYLMKGGNKYISRYPEEDLVKILKDLGYHSEEWEQTDSEDDGEAVKKLSLYVYEKWWRSSAVCIYLLYFRFIY
jgi:hypothetical protein